jgi:Fe-S-cluster containining protein
MALKTEFQELIDKAKAEKQTIKKEFNRLKLKKSKDVDSEFHKRHVAAFKKIDCLDCANCCKTTSPIFRDVDIKRISKELRMKEAQFISNYLKMDEENDYVLRSSPCHFLGDDNKCSIYHVRPLACREYPHTDRKNMLQILALTEKNTEICPAVAGVALGMIGSKG